MRHKERLLKKNIGTAERVLRVACTIWPLVMPLGGGGLLLLLPYVALIAVGVDFVVTASRLMPIVQSAGLEHGPAIAWLEDVACIKKITPAGSAGC